MGIFDKLFGKKDNKRKQVNSDAGRINYLIGAFNKALTNSQFREAIKHGEELAQIFKETGNKANESACYTNLGNAYYSLGDFRKAIEYHEKSLKIAKDIGDRAVESKCYGNLGVAYRNLKDFRKAIEYHEKSLKIAKDIGDREGESVCYTNLGNAYYSLGDFRKAIEYHEKSLKIAKDIGDRAVESKCYTNLGNAYDSLGDFRKSIEYIENYLKIAKYIGNKAVESAGYLTLGFAYYKLGDFKKAIEYHEKSLEIAKYIGNKAVDSKCYTGLGVAYLNLGDFRKAIEYHEKSLEIAKDIGDREGESKCYGNLGVTYRNLGDFKKAIEYHEKSMIIAKDIGDRAGESAGYTNLGIAYANLNDFKKAIDFFEKSLEIKKDIVDKAGESKCYRNLGSSYLSLGDFNKAIEFHEKSLKINREIGDRTGESACYTNLGIVYYSIGNFKKATEFYDKSLEIDKDIGDRAGESIVCGNLAVAYYYNKQDYQKSLDYARESIKITEQVRESLVKEELSLKFLKTKIGVYDLAINSAINLYKETDDENCLKDALEIIERTKSRELMKIIKAKKKDPEAEKEYHELKGVEIKIGELEAKIKSAVEGKRSVEREVQEKNELHKKRSELYKKIREKSLDPSSIVPTLDEDITKEFWGVFGKHADNCSVLQIYEQEERIIYVLFNKEKFEFFEKEVTGEGRKLGGEQLGNMRDPYMPASTYYENLKNIIGIILPENLIGKLGDIKTKELFIIPHKWLHQIPWEAVLVGGEPLCLRYNMVRHYSLDLIRSSLIYEKRENKNALLVSNPKPSEHSDLPGAEVECNKIKDILKKFNVIHLNREYAKIDEVEKNVLNTSIIHFACHGSFNSNDPFESSVLFSSDKKLSANDISLKNLDYYPLVFLNACETGITTSDKVIGGVGDEQIGLVRAFAMAHSPAIIVAGWRIDDAVAKYFAEQFYTALSDKNVMDALSHARKETYEKFKDTSKDWAAYMLYGNPFRKL